MSGGDTQKMEKALYFSTFNGSFGLLFEQRDLPFYWALQTVQPALPITFCPQMGFVCLGPPTTTPASPLFISLHCGPS